MLRRLAIRVRGDVEKARGLTLRHQCVSRLARTPGIEPHLIERANFLGSAAAGVAGLEKERREFLENLLQADYALCLRGKGNFSFRLYEVLSLGRVPLLLNTDCVLPFEDEIDWRSHVVMIEEREGPRIGECLLERHRAMSPATFVAMQQNARQLWQDYLEPSSFFARAIARELAAAR